ncbi:class I SAM-dependent methyltransferase [Moorena sp. SIO3H5]|uniref:class I SAM-dependent methyltransferase n=1 Tax=Moorena sp. SIO3H5 TaxID=2607834 RepID=UPI0013B921D2|nr:class I SAM-dependent methyltransferase [Moorena sp. SIO3H5]NEO71896.1 class I SAM-dependent methyltransferase [Moorena sp. SIO3H5]
MKYPLTLLDPLDIDPRNSEFAGPYEIGYEHLSKLFPGLDSQFVSLEVGPMIENGGISYTELAILAALTRWLQPKQVLEIGTFHGWTSHNLALQLSDDAELVTINLPDGRTPRLDSGGWNARYFPVDKTPLFFEGRPTANRIKQIKEDTANLSAKDFQNKFDLIFIDGSHSFAYVENDTKLALSVANEQAIILWHDYGKPAHWAGVIEYLHRSSREGHLYPLYWLHHYMGPQTSLILYIRGLRADL